MCGIFGVFGSARAAHLAQLGLYSLQHRGQESVGVAVFDKEGSARVVRSMGTMSSKMAADLDEISGTAAAMVFQSEGGKLRSARHEAPPGDHSPVST